jgi:ATP-binding protein involved in chromosome partitioning
MGGRRPVKGVKNILAVASGKGGVGKSTVSANIAVALRKAGARVGLLDADIYGPSIPTLLNLKKHQLLGENDMILPAEADGIRVLSMGFLLEEDSPVIWRGPMLMKALTQFLHGTKWGELDYLVIDLPPGTGDVQLSLVQTTPVAGAIVVTTPQDLALIDVKKAVRAEETCRKMGLRFLGEVPIQATVREASDAGVPIVTQAPDSPAAVAIAKVASETAAALAVLSQV